MSYDHYVLPAAACDDAASAAAHIGAQGDQATNPDAMAIAAAITSRNAPLDDQHAFLSIQPLQADGDVVAVPAPYSRVQEARDVVVDEAMRAGFGVYDPQNGVVIDPRQALRGLIESSTEGRYPVITPDVAATLVHRLREDDYLILETAPQVYIQTQRRDEHYAVEHRAGSPDRHVGIEVDSPTEVVATMRLWLAGDHGTLARLPWRKLQL